MGSAAQSKLVLQRGPFLTAVCPVDGGQDQSWDPCTIFQGLSRFLAPSTGDDGVRARSCLSDGTGCDHTSSLLCIVPPSCGKITDVDTGLIHTATHPEAQATWAQCAALCASTISLLAGGKLKCPTKKLSSPYRQKMPGLGVDTRSAQTVSC